MRITCDPSKWQRTLAERGLDMRRAKEVFAGIHFTRAERIISMRHCHEREAKRLHPYFSRDE